MNISVESVQIDIPKHLSKTQGDKLGRFASVQWHKLYYGFVPMRTGTLANTVVYEPWLIKHTVPYAHYIYEGKFSFRRDSHPLASRQWDKKAIPTQ